MFAPEGAQFRGVGVDLVAVERVAAARRRTPSFTESTFTEQEQQHAFGGGEHPDRRFAGRWAAKEAVVKALGCGADVVQFVDIEIAASDTGAPVVNLYGTAADRAAAIGVTGVNVSITHDKEHAVAAAVAYNHRVDSHETDRGDLQERSWNELGLTGTDRQAWEQFGLTPAETAAYLRLGITDPSEAAHHEASGGIDAVHHLRAAQTDEWHNLVR